MMDETSKNLNLDGRRDELIALLNVGKLHNHYNKFKNKDGFSLVLCVLESLIATRLSELDDWRNK
jgi:hypothetical protein